MKRVMLSEHHGIDIDSVTRCQKRGNVELPNGTVEFEIDGKLMSVAGPEADVLWALWTSLAEKTYKRMEEKS